MCRENADLLPLNQHKVGKPEEPNIAQRHCRQLHQVVKLKYDQGSTAKTQTSDGRVTRGGAA
jgi:hypothetical protein